MRRACFRYFSVAKAAALAVSMHCIAAEAAPSGPVKVGVISPLTGQMATYGQETVNGLKLAKEHLANDPVKFELLVEDTQGTPKGSVEAFNKLVSSDKVAAVIGEVASSNTLAVASLAENDRVPLVTSASTNDTITSGKKFVFRTCFVDSFQGRVMARFARDELKATTAMIVFDSDSDYSRGLRKAFQESFVSFGGKIAGEVSYSQRDTDFTTQMSKVRREKPDVVFLPGYYSQVGPILRQAHELGIKARFLGTDGWDSPKLFELAKEGAAGHFVSSHFSAEDTDPKVQKFVKEYEAKYRARPGALAALGYDAGLFLHDAIRRAASAKPEDIQKAIAGTDTFPGITGTFRFDGGNVLKSAVVLSTTANGWKFHSRVEP